ncbi:MAG TPA: cellulase family glycosylhydrolase [Spirochaetota bacterium]|nr:cellulase family glycosylhydrolase [Spirochaetota bacterium]
MRKIEETPLCNKILYQYLLILIFLFSSCNPTVTDDKTEWEKVETVPITCDDFLKADGKILRKKKGTGDIVFLKGVNAGGYLFQEFWMTPTEYSNNIKAEIDLYENLTKRFGKKSMFALVKLYQDNYWEKKDFDNCAKLGMNVIRLPFWYMNFVDFEGNLKNDCFDKLDWFIKEAGYRGLYVILDFHGAPGSQNGSDHSGVDGGDSKEKASEFFFGKNASVNQKMYYMIWEKS